MVLVLVFFALDSFICLKQVFDGNLERKSEIVRATSNVPKVSFIFYCICEPSTTNGEVCEVFGYAEDFRLVKTQPADIQLHLESADWCCEENKMNLNENKSHILPVKQQQNSKNHFKLKSNFLEGKTERKGLGKIIFAKIYWKANNQKRCDRNLKAFYFFKRNVSVLTNSRTKS